MQISFEEAQFLMQLMEDYYNSFSDNVLPENRGWKMSRGDSEDSLSYEEIENLWSRVQEEKLRQVN